MNETKFAAQHQILVMIHLLKSLILAGLLYGTPTHSGAPTVTLHCQELTLSILLPTGFQVLDSSQLNALGQRGDKAVKESFNKETLQGWQHVCFNHQDSLKRTIILTAITVKEAIAANGSTDQFMAKTFADANLFIIRRFKDRANIDIDAQQAVQQSELTIAGMKVRKNAFTFLHGSRLMFFARNYFFQRNGKLYLLSFTGSPKATDNEEIVRAIEQAKTL